MARRPKRRSTYPKAQPSGIATIRRPRRRRTKKASSGRKTPVSFNHRTHPSKLLRQPPGYCRWCGTEILKVDGTINRRRSWCSKTCVGQYLLRSDPKVMRQHVFFRDKGTCADCGKQWMYMSDPWQADHQNPLYTAFGDWSFWEPENVVVLCTDPCHKAKTKADLAKFGHLIKRGKDKRQVSVQIVEPRRNQPS